MARAYLPLYFSYAEPLAELPDADCKSLVLALLDYAQNGTLPEFASASAPAVVFSLMRSQVDRDVAKYAERCEKNRVNAQKRWEADDTTVCNRIQSYATDAKNKAHDKDKAILFAQFWSAYPKKRDKTKAARAFDKLHPDEQLLAEILAALDWQKQSPDWLKDGGQFVPYASSYLNGRRWEDEPPQNNAPARPDTPKLRWTTNENGEKEAIYDE